MSMTLIQHIELGSNQASITFSSVPQTFTDLYLLVSLRTNRSGPDVEDAVRIEFNSVTTGYSRRSLRGDGTNAASFSASDAFSLQNQNSNGSTANTFSNAAVYIPNYRVSAAKSISVDTVAEQNGTTQYMNIVAGLWNNTAAITSLTMTPNVGTGFVTASSATLYGITSGSAGGVTVT